jgi:ferric-dicitrate binding protein FerR (iron transport regulator)
VTGPSSREGARGSSAPSAALALLELEAPLRRSTQLELDEWTVRRLWENIRSEAPGGASVRRASRRRTKWSAVLAVATLVLAAWVGIAAPWHTRVFQGPLVTAEGKRFESLDAPAERSARIDFADGSQIEAAPGARIEGLAATANEFVLLLRRGKAHFSVTPGGPRRWLIEARGASVEVVGTHFSVESSTGMVAVSVESGVVLVRSPLLADGVQRLGAGQSLRLDTGPSEAGLEQAPPAPGTQAPRAPGAERDTGADQDEPARAIAEPRAARLAPRAQRRTRESAAELWSGADHARRAGDAARAAELLERLIVEHPEDSQAALGAYTIGVLQLEQLARPRAAARHFEQALQLGISSGLRESCYLRWAEALREAGDARAASSVAREYLRSYPLGEQRDTMQKLLEPGGSSK